MNCDIAIISMACRFPKAKTIEEFWNNLIFSKDTIHTFSDDELRRDGIDYDLISDPKYVKRRGIIDDIEHFDFNFFNISPYEASITDPQHKIFLEICWEALEMAGCVGSKSDELIGVFAGCSDNTYYDNILKKSDEFLNNFNSYHANTVNSSHFLATRVSYLLNLKGPSISVSTGCSTSLVAVTQACQSLILGDCDIALAGGVTIRVPQNRGYLYQEGSIYSVDGKCRAFDDAASGTVPSNGAGVVVLKRLEDALRDGDNIDAVIKGYNINNDGADKAGYTAPSVIEQTRCIATALSEIENVKDIIYVEAHGTGTILGDPIEIASLTRAFGFYTKEKNFCAIGSVKTNIGHTDVAAGVAGLIKTVLVLKNRAIPPTLNFTRPNRRISFEQSPFYVCNEAISLLGYPRELYAGVSSFGIGGTNAHVILKEYKQEKGKSISKPSYLILLSAGTADALINQQNNFLDYLNQQSMEDKDLEDIAYTLQVGRKPFKHRKALICRNIKDLKEILAKEDYLKVISGQGNSILDSKIVFLFQGQGNLYQGALHEIYNEIPEFKFYFDECCSYLDLDIKTRILSYLIDINNIDHDNSPIVQQLAMFIVEYGLAKTYMDFGIKPSVLLGHSLGEYVAFCIAGVLTLQDAIELVTLRAKLTSKLPKGMMLSVPFSVDKIKEYLDDSEVSIAAINAPDSTVISGSENEVTRLQHIFDGLLKDVGQKCTKLNIPYAFHSKEVEKILNEYETVLDSLVFHHSEIPLLLSVTGEFFDYNKVKPNPYFIDHFRKPVLFSECVKRLMYRGSRFYFEIGLGKTLINLLKQHQENLITISSLASAKEIAKSDISQFEYFYRALGQCWVNFVDVDWRKVYGGDKNESFVKLPTYPFERKPSWLNVSTEVVDNKGHFVYEPYWEPVLYRESNSFVGRENWLVFMDDFGVGKKFVKKLKAQKQNVICVYMGDGFKTIGKYSYQVDYKDRDSYVQFVEFLVNRKQLPHHIIHLWSISKDENIFSRGLSEQVLDKGFFSLVNFIQIFKEHKQSLDFKLTIITNHLKAIFSDDYIVPEKSTLLGLNLVLPQESSALSRVVDCDVFNLPLKKQDNLISAILNEIIVQPVDNVVVFRNGFRFVSKHRIFADKYPEKATNYLRKNGVYIITGGLGKVGLALAEFLANNYNANLILIARSVPKNNFDTEVLAVAEEIDGKVKKIKSSASSLRILRADVSNYKELYKAFAEIKANFPKIDGLFHLAASLGINARALIKDITIEQAYAQFKPKVVGTKLLDKLADELLEPEFCVIFSSLSAVVGGMGLCSYAAANCGVDSMVEFYRNSGRTGVHWFGLNWDALGVDSAKKTALSLNQAFRLLERVLGHKKASSLVIVKSNLESLKNVWVNCGRKSADLDEDKNIGKKALSQRIDVKGTLKRLFKDCLGVKDIGVKDDFYNLGGDSLLLLRLYEMIDQTIPNRVKLVDLMRNRSIDELTNFIKNKTVGNKLPSLVKIKSSGKTKTLFFIHPIGGTVFCYLELAKYLAEDISLFVIQDPRVEPEPLLFCNIEEVAKYYLQLIKAVQKDGHYLIGGYSFGANVAFEIARELESQGKTLDLFLIDGWAKYSERIRDRNKSFESMLKIANQINSMMPNFIYNEEKFINLLWERMEMLFSYKPQKIASKVVLFKADKVLPEYQDVDDPGNHWQKYLSKGTIDVQIINGDHLNILEFRGAKQIAQVLNKYSRY